MERLSTGTSGLDRLLKGGFALRQINLVYGEASTGKTVLAMQSALGATARGFKVFFVDADLSFSVQRLESLDRGRELAENIVVFQPEDFREQTRITESLEVLLISRSLEQFLSTTVSSTGSWPIFPTSLQDSSLLSC